MQRNGPTTDSIGEFSGNFIIVLPLINTPVGSSLESKTWMLIFFRIDNDGRPLSKHWTVTVKSRKSIKGHMEKRNLLRCKSSMTLSHSGAVW